MQRHYKVRVWAIVGESNTGKSTIIQHLTSQFDDERTEKNDVLLRGGGYLRLFSRRRAWQEAGLLPNEVVDLINDKADRMQNERPVVSTAYFNVLMALRFLPNNFDDGKRSVLCPTAHEYLSHFVEQGWLLESFVLLAPEDAQVGIYSRYGVPTYFHEHAGQDWLEKGWLVGLVRNHFGWA